MGVRHYIVTPDLLDQPEARPGRAGAEDWLFTPLGRAVFADPAADRTWEEL